MATAATQEFKIRWWVPGDWNAFFGLFTNVALNVIVLSGLVLGVIEMPGDVVFGRILPALGIALPLGNLWYRRTARNFNPLMATAARVTIAEAGEILAVGELEPESVVTPHLYVDVLVEEAGALRFRERVPIAEYENLRPYVDEQRRTGSAALTSEPPLFYAQTSGSTGAPKLIPITRRMLELHKREQALFSYLQYRACAAAFAGRTSA